jgi:asparagine synthase (glutamine-hydrolysing)
MCGIVFYYSQKGNQQEARRKVNSALKLIRYRGPDEKGVWQGRNTVIGHVRLSIIDLCASSQPMVDPVNRFILAFNGEIYNYKELKRELESKWEFKTNGDTEVVLAGLILLGKDFLSRMEGMWAIAFWDSMTETLFLSRDRMGKKPLFYHRASGSFICTSELNALSCLNPDPFQEDMNSTADYLRYGYYLPGTTIYKDVFEVLPGHVLTWKSGKLPEEKPYWSLNIGKFSGTKEQATNLLREKLVCAVKKRLVSDVEVGAFLSGGIDSSLIVGILSRELNTRVKTFTIGFSEKSYDERKYANQVAARFGTDHFSRQFENWDRDKLISLILNHAGQPFADSSILPTSLVSEIAAQKVKVVLSGDGGDELFCGYQRYLARAILRWYTWLPKFFTKNIEHLVKLFPEPVAHHSRSVIKKAHLFIDIVNRQKDETPYIAPLLYSQDDFGRLAPDLINCGHTPPGIPRESSCDTIQEMMAADALIYLPQDILTKVDRASMAHSLEARAPFLDSEVVELAFSLPLAWHYSRLNGKKMLKNAFGDLLPDSVWKRRKQGFGVPIHQWFKQGLENRLLELAGQNQTPVQIPVIENMLEAHSTGKRDNGYRLWNLFIYLTWKDQQSHGRHPNLLL